RALRSRLPLAKLTAFQHGLYLIIAVRRDWAVEEVRRTAGEIATHVAGSGLPVKHAGSFGFDFVALDWYSDPIDRTNSIRVCGADLPLQMTDEIGQKIAAWCLRRGAKMWRYGVSFPSRVAA